MKNTPLQTKLIVVVTVILLIGFLATNIISYEVSKETIRSSLLQNELPLSSDNIYSEIQADLLKPISISSQMANDAFLIDWVINGESNADQMVRYLKRIQTQYATSTSFFISNATLKYYHFEKVSRIISEQNHKDEWFFREREMETPYEINVDENLEKNQAITVFVNHRVLDFQGNFIGITGVGLGIDSVSALVRRYQHDFNRDVYFIDAKGVVRLHSNPAFIGKNDIRSMSGLKVIAKKLLSQPRGSFTYERDGETVLLTTRYIPELKWFLMVELDECEATSEIQKSFQINLAIGFVAILITILLISYTIRIFQKRLEYCATMDKLTGIGNRFTCDFILGNKISLYKRNSVPFSLILFDIDLFKRVNDKMGHLAGDEVLQNIAKLTQSLIRESDDVCRWGGEEFIILLNDCPEYEARLLAEKVREAIAEASLLKGDKEYQVTASFGLSVFRENDSKEELLERADKALYRAKAQGRNCTCWE